MAHVRPASEGAPILVAAHPQVRRAVPTDRLATSERRRVQPAHGRTRLCADYRLRIATGLLRAQPDRRPSIAVRNAWNDAMSHLPPRSLHSPVGDAIRYAARRELLRRENNW